MRYLRCALLFFFFFVLWNEHASFTSAQSLLLPYGPTLTLNGTCPGASGLTIDPRARTLFVGCSTANSILKFPYLSASNSTNGSIPFLTSNCVYPEGLFWDAPTNSLYATCNGDNIAPPSVLKITRNSAGGAGTVVALPGVSADSCFVHYVTVDVDGSVFASCDSGGILKWTSVSQNPIVLSDGGFGNCYYSRQIVINPETGDIFLACMGSGTILRWVNGAGTAVVHALCSGAQGLAIADNGDLYAGCGYESVVVRYSFDAASHQYSSIRHTLTGFCSSVDGVNLAWASNGLFATCVTENALKYWSVDALRTNSGPDTLGPASQANIAVTPYGENVFTTNFFAGTVSEWQLLGLQ